MKRLFPDRTEIFLLLIAAAIGLYAIRENQLRPHHLTIRLGTTVLTDRMVTNRFEVIAYGTNVWTPHGQEFRLAYETNELWKVWGIFQ